MEVHIDFRVRMIRVIASGNKILKAEFFFLYGFYDKFSSRNLVSKKIESGS